MKVVCWPWYLHYYPVTFWNIYGESKYVEILGLQKGKEHIVSYFCLQQQYGSFKCSRQLEMNKMTENLNDIVC